MNREYMKINKVINLLEEQYPANGADQEDFIGLQVGNEESDITGILVTLDVTLEVINQAIDSNSNLIISHHPLVFDELDSKNIDKYTMAKIEMLNKLNIAVFVIHTNAD
ncbi:MAG: hypothetical protein DRP42_00915 [Tenericutes bacterium]|nr:MAG: hypothetical protein DRP42_00915 [Mycoplasmatota bacterium]